MAGRIVATGLAFAGALALAAPQGAGTANIQAATPAVQTTRPKPASPKPPGQVPRERTSASKAPPSASAWDIAAAWALVALIVLLAGSAALHPIIYYIRTVWASRQQLIFDTLGWRAKARYLELYHRSDGRNAAPPPPPAPVPPPAPSSPKPPVEGGRSWRSVLADPHRFRSFFAPTAYAPPPPPPPPPLPPVLIHDPVAEQDAVARFEQVYDKWFGRGRLLVPAAILAAILLFYAFLAAVVATRDLLGAAAPSLPFKVGPIALAAMTGAYILVAMDTIERVTRRDLLPDDLNLNALRLASAVPLGYVFTTIAKPDAAPFVALAITALPLREVADLLRRLGEKRIGVEAPTAVPTLDAPSRLAGVDRAVCERLSAIGVDTISQLACSDPVQLTMRTSLNFVFVLDIVSQALAWLYLEDRLNVLRPMGLRGSREIALLRDDARDATSSGHANAQAMLQQLPEALKLSAEQINNALDQIADDPYTRFLLLAYASD